MSVEGIPVAPPQPLLDPALVLPPLSPDGAVGGGEAISSCIAPLGSIEKVSKSHDMLMEELKSFTAEKRKLRPVGIVNPCARGQSETPTTGTTRTNKKGVGLGLVASPKQSPKLVSLAQSNKSIAVGANTSSGCVRKGKCKKDVESEGSTSEDDEKGDTHDLDLKGLSQVLSGLQLQIEKLSKNKRRNKSRKKKENVNEIPECAAVSIEPEPRFDNHNDEQFIRKIAADEWEEECDQVDAIVAIQQVLPTISQHPPTPIPSFTPESEEKQKIEPVALEEKGTSLKAKLKLNLDGILERRASLRSNSSPITTRKPRSSPSPQQSQSATQNPKYDNLVEEFTKFTFKRNVVPNSHRLSNENCQPVVNESILKKVESWSAAEQKEVHVPTRKEREKKVFSGKPSTSANEIGKKLNIEQAFQEVKKKREKAGRKVEPVEKVDSQNRNSNIDSKEEDEQGVLDSDPNLNSLLASLTPQQLLKLQQKCKSKIVNRTSEPPSIKPKPSKKKKTGGNLTPPPPPLSIVVPDANPHRSQLLHQIQCFSRRNLRNIGKGETSQTRSGSAAPSTSSGQESIGSPRVLKDVLQRRFEALNGDEAEETSEPESSSDSDQEWIVTSIKEKEGDTLVATVASNVEEPNEVQPGESSASLSLTYNNNGITPEPAALSNTSENTQAEAPSNVEPRESNEAAASFDLMDLFGKLPTTRSVKQTKPKPKTKRKKKMKKKGKGKEGKDSDSESKEDDDLDDDDDDDDNGRVMDLGSEDRVFQIQFQ